MQENWKSLRFFTDFSGCHGPLFEILYGLSCKETPCQQTQTVEIRQMPITHKMSKWSSPFSSRIFLVSFLIWIHFSLLNLIRLMANTFEFSWVI
jgi:hypothetical protein